MKIALTFLWYRVLFLLNVINKITPLYNTCVALNVALQMSMSVKRTTGAVLTLARTLTEFSTVAAPTASN